MGQINLTADATQGVAAVQSFEDALATMITRFGQLNKVTEYYSSTGERSISTVEAQVGAYTKLTQTIAASGTVLNTVFTQNEALRRRDEAAEAARIERNQARFQQQMERRQAAEDRAAGAAASRAAANDVKEAQRAVNAAQKRQNAEIRAEEQARQAIEDLADKYRIKQQGRLAKETADREKAAAQQLAMAEKHGNALGNLAERIGRNFVQFLSYRAFNNITHGIEEGIEAAKEFQVQLSLIRTISQGSQQSHAKFAEDVRGVSDQSGIGIKDVGKAFYDVASNQVAKGADIKPFVATATELARTTGSTLPDAVNVLSSAINSYGGSAADAEKISALWFRTVDDGRVVLSEVANTIGRVNVLADNLGVSMEEVNATIAVTTQKGFKTTDAMTLLTNVLIKLEKPTKATQAFFQGLGVDSGESAIQLYGFTGVLRKMVEAVKSGQVDVSAFFDEIRGRKQFAVFQQSIDEIEKLGESYKNLGQSAKIYNEAKSIRGESAADLLIKEVNKLKNIDVTIGSKILDFVASIVSAVGGVETMTKVTSALIPLIVGAGAALAAGTIHLIAWRTGVISVIAANGAATVSFAGLATAIGGASVALLAAFAGYEATKFLLNAGGGQNKFGVTDPAVSNAAAEALKRYQIELRKADELAPQHSELEDAKKTTADNYRTILGLVAQTTLANNKMLDDAKMKSKELSETLKVNFAGATDLVKKNISDIERALTVSQDEVRKSKQIVGKSADKINDEIFAVNSRYASPQQLVGGGILGDSGILKDRINSLTKKATGLFQDKKSTPEQIEEARHLFDEIGKLQEQQFEKQTELKKKAFEEGLANGSIPQNPYGPNVFNVDVSKYQASLNKLLIERNKLEADYQKLQELNQKKKVEQLEVEKEKMRTVQAAFKAYEEIDVYDNKGKLKKDFSNKEGRLDTDKLTAATSKQEDIIRKNLTLPEGAEGNKARFDLELSFSQKRMALNKEAKAADNAEFLKNAEVRASEEDKDAQKKLDNVKRVRDEAEKNQKRLIGDISANPINAKAFANQLFAGGGVSPATKEDIDKRLATLQEKTQKVVDTKGIIDPKVAEDAINEYLRLLDFLEAERVAVQSGKRPGIIGRNIPGAQEVIDASPFKAKNKAAVTSDLAIDANGQPLSVDSAQRAAQQQGKELIRAGGDQVVANEKQEQLKGQLAKSNDEVAKLKAAFPDLAESVKSFAGTVDREFKALNQGGLKEFQERLEEIQRTLPKVTGGKDNKQSSILGVDQGFAYAARGGIAGLFPGQPRGVDQYPIWAARGEAIIPANVTATYRPMIDALINGRPPQYMASGGIVGDSTNVGDINISVNGSNTNVETVRAIGHKLERAIRQRVINLKGRPD